MVVFLLAAGALAMVTAGAAGEENEGCGETAIEIIHVRHRAAAELLAPVRAALSPNGRASLDRVGNAIVVVDAPARIPRLRSLVHALDVPVPLVTVRLRYRRQEENTRRLSTVSGIDSSRPGLRLGHGQLQRQTELMLRVASGSSGYLRLGREIPVTRGWIELCGRYGFSHAWLTDYRRLESGLEVTPLVLADRVDLTLVPKISFAAGRSIVFTAAATRLSVPPDTWVSLAGAIGSSSEAMTWILGRGAPATMAMEVFCSVNRR
ncbi:secretin N-terminal domain-containing protein [Thermodesulfobacteriota bacterium B35]